MPPRCSVGKGGKKEAKMKDYVPQHGDLKEYHVKKYGKEYVIVLIYNAIRKWWSVHRTYEKEGI